ncbi:MAG: hypothetical protein PHN28_11755 [Aquabacterium sp.]|nr:hypothetical protein [Aquabacterium sp.]
MGREFLFVRSDSGRMDFSGVNLPSMSEASLKPVGQMFPVLLRN